MKRFLLTLILLFPGLVIVQAQTFTWGSQFKDMGSFSSLRPRDGFIYGTGNGTVLSKADSKGKILWTKKINYLNGYFISDDHAGNFYIGGNFNGNPSIDTKGGTVSLSTYVGDMFLAKMDTSGAILWIKQSKSNAAAYMKKMDADDNGNVFFTGEFNNKVTLETTSFESKGMTDAFVAAYGPDGTLKWCKQAGGSGNDGISGMLLTPAGKLVVTGSYEKDIMFDTKAAPKTGGLAGFKTEINPATGEAGTISMNLSMIYNLLAFNPQKNAIYANVLFTGKLTAGAHTVNSPGATGSAIITMDPDFKPVDVYQIYVAPVAMAAANDGTVTMGGEFETSITMAPGTTYNTMGESDIYLVSYDNKGHMLWSIHSGGPNIDNITGIGFSEDRESLLISGSVQSGPAHFGSVTIPGDLSGAGFLLKMNAPVSGIAPTPVDPEGRKVTMKPNPIRNMGILMIDLGDDARSNSLWMAEIYGMDGRCVHAQTVSGTDNKMPVEVDKPGVYLIRVHNDTEVRTGKLVVQ